MRNRANFTLRAPAQVRIHVSGLGNGFFGNFVDRSWSGFLLAEAISLAECFQFIRAHGFHDVTIQLAQVWVTIYVEPTSKQLVQRGIELFPGFTQVASPEILLACLKCRLTLDRQPLWFRPARSKPMTPDTQVRCRVASIGNCGKVLLRTGKAV